MGALEPMDPWPEAASAAVARETYTHAMSRAVTGVSVVCADGPDGRVALTVSAVSSVSADPPLLLACVQRRNPLRAAVLSGGRFSVSLLAAHQSAIADTCAGRGPAPKHDLSSVPFVPGAAGLPVVDGAAACFECELQAAHESGSHTILIGRVIAAAAGTAKPLLYHARAYGQPAPLAIGGQTPGSDPTTPDPGV